jgi:hypothetical protein
MDGVASLLTLDRTGLFDRVVLAWLLHMMKEWIIPQWLVKQVNRFICNWTVTVCLPGYNTDAFPTHTMVSYSLALAPMLFLFNNFNLAELISPQPPLPQWLALLLMWILWHLANWLRWTVEHW